MQLGHLPAFERLTNLLGERASFVISQGIDYRKDSFTLSVRRLAYSPGDTILSKADVIRLRLLPSGSRWRQGLGWHSYFGIPFRLDGRQWVAIGAEAIVRYRQKYAHPVFLAFVFSIHSSQDQQLLERLQSLAADIYPGVRRAGRTRTGVVFSSSRTIAEHAWLEAWIIQAAAITYRIDKQPLLFRTLILAEDEIRKPGYPGPNFWGSRSGYLMATVPSIRRTFSLRTRIKLFICRTYLVPPRR